MLVRTTRLSVIRKQLYLRTPYYVSVCHHPFFTLETTHSLFHGLARVLAVSTSKTETMAAHPIMHSHTVEKTKTKDPCM